MRGFLINFLIGIVAIITITYYSLSSDGGDIIYIFLSIVFFGIHFLSLILSKSMKEKKWALIGVLVCVFVSFITFYCINEKRSE
jgi:heme/copper-type cytochrome/quinol oxidase subunit 4